MSNPGGNPCSTGYVVNASNGGEFVTSGVGTTINSYDLGLMISSCWQPNAYSGGSTTGNGLLMSGDGVSNSYFPSNILTSSIGGTIVSIINQTTSNQNVVIAPGDLSQVQYGDTYMTNGNGVSITINNSGIYTFVNTGNGYWVLISDYGF